MKNELYVYKGSLFKFDDADFFMNLFELNQGKYIVKDKIKDLIPDDEKFEIVSFEISDISTLPHGISILIPRYYNIYINLKASTIALIALLLDINVTKGLANFVLAATGVNLRLIVKLDEAEGEKCVLLEVYRKEDHQANPDIFKQICGKECINNDMNCKYRRNGICTMDQVRVKEILDNLSDKNVLTKNNDFYKYNF